MRIGEIYCDFERKFIDPKTDIGCFGCCRYDMCVEEIIKKQNTLIQNIKNGVK